MKHYLSAALGLVCIVVVISLVMVKRSDDARHEDDVGVIVDFSNRLTSAQTQLAVCQGGMITLSNSLDESRSASLTLSNHLHEAETTLALDKEQITNLSRQVANMKSENQVLAQHVVDLTNRMASLTTQLASTEARLDQSNKDHARNYALLENRLRRDVAERVVVERRFNNPSELRAQLQRLKEHPAEQITAESIYAGLDVEVNSNGTFHVLSPD